MDGKRCLLLAGSCLAAVFQSGLCKAATREPQNQAHAHTTTSEPLTQQHLSRSSDPGQEGGRAGRWPTLAQLSPPPPHAPWPSALAPHARPPALYPLTSEKSSKKLSSDPPGQLLP